jgi:hypothetical protein
MVRQSVEIPVMRRVIEVRETSGGRVLHYLGLAGVMYEIIGKVQRAWTWSGQQ